jgi:hypothetical protein
MSLFGRLSPSQISSNLLNSAPFQGNVIEYELKDFVPQEADFILEVSSVKNATMKVLLTNYPHRVYPQIWVWLRSEPKLILY